MGKTTESTDPPQGDIGPLSADVVTTAGTDKPALPFYLRGRNVRPWQVPQWTACPRCGAPTGRSCRSVSGKPRKMNHIERVNAAEQAYAREAEPRRCGDAMG